MGLQRGGGTAEVILPSNEISTELRGELTVTDPPAQQPFQVKPVLTGDLLLLRPFNELDIAAMGPILADPDLLRLTGAVHTTAEANNRSAVLDQRTLDWYRGLAARGDRLDLAIIDRPVGPVRR